MRKFLMAAAVLAVAACGEAAEEGMEDTTTMAPAPAETMMDTTTMAPDSGAMGGDTTMAADTTHQM